MVFTLEKLPLTSKQCLKFLNTFCLFPKDKFMLFVRQSYKVLGSIISAMPIIGGDPDYLNWLAKETEEQKL